jgi:hypothetical protein
MTLKKIMAQVENDVRTAVTQGINQRRLYAHGQQLQVNRGAVAPVAAMRYAEKSLKMVLKYLSPARGALYRAWRHDSERQVGDAAQASTRKEMYIYLMIATKLGSSAAPPRWKLGAKALDQLFDCRRRNLNSPDMRNRNNNIPHTIMRLIGSSLGGWAGASLGLLHSHLGYAGYFVGSEAGAYALGALSSSYLETPAATATLPPVHKKYWGYGIDKDAINFLVPLRAQYEATDMQLAEIKERMQDIMFAYSIADQAQRDPTREPDGHDLTKELAELRDLFAQNYQRYINLNNEHVKEVDKILHEPRTPDIKDRVLKANMQDKPRVKKYRKDLKDYLARKHHDEMVGLVRFAEYSGALNIPAATREDVDAGRAQIVNFGTDARKSARATRAARGC